MRFEHALQAARGLGAGTASAYLHCYPVRDLESAKWKLWHGRSSSCLGRLAKLANWLDCGHVRDVRSAVAARRHIDDLIEYLHANRHALVNYRQRRHEGLPISTAFVESAVNEILSKRMIKKQQMRWNRWTVQPFLDVRIAVLNKTLAARSGDFIPPSKQTMIIMPCRSQPDRPTILHALPIDPRQPGSAESRSMESESAHMATK